jgi:hypothetical protein
MAQATPVLKTVLEAILDWSNDRPAWQRDALRRIVFKGRLDSADITELVSLCKKGKGNATVILATAPLEKVQLPVNPFQSRMCTE